MCVCVCACGQTNPSVYHSQGGTVQCHPSAALQPLSLSLPLTLIRLDPGGQHGSPPHILGTILNTKTPRIGKVLNLRPHLIGNCE